MKTFCGFNLLIISSIRSNFYFGILFICILFIPFHYSQAQAIKTLANEVTFTSPNDRMTSVTGCGLGNLLPCYGASVSNPSNALIDNNQFSRLFASPGLALGLASYDGELELKFPATLPAETWSYVRIGADQNLLQALLGGSLGDLLGDALGAVLLGKQEIEIQARNSGGTTVLVRNSTQGFDTERVRLVQNGSGNYYLAIKPAAAYDRIRVINRSTSAAGLGVEYTLGVYNAFYLSGDDACGDFRFTSFDGEGISLDLLGAGVEDAENAIDSDLDTYSEISIGTLGVGAAIYQSVYYETPSSPEDYFKVKLGVANAGALTADLIGGIEIRAYDGSDLVYIRKLSGGLINGLDVLGLLQSGSTVTLPFGPGVPFDRVTVGYTSVVSLNALSNSPIRLYDVQRFGATCPDPDPIPLPTATDPMLSNSTCDATVLAFENANFPLNTVDGNNDTYSTLNASSGVALGIGDYEGFIELGFDSRAAGTTSYVRIDFDEEVLLGLLDGTAGQLLGGVVDNVLFGNHYFTVEVKNNGSQVLESSSNNGFFNQPVKIVQDKNNYYYVAVTPSSPYTSIRITESLGAVAGLGEVRSMNVYHVCTSTGFEPCEQAFATYAESQGISLDLLGLGAAGVVDAGFAIDGDPSTASEISIGAAGLGSGIYQYVDFHSLSAPTDHFRVKLAMEGENALTAEVLGSIVIKAFDGDTEVFSQDLRDGLISGLDLLGLLQSGGTLNLPFGPGLAFDKVAVGIESVVSANVIQNPVKVFSIERFSSACPDPELADPPQTIPPFNTSDCAAEVVDWSNTNFPLNAVDGNNDSYAVLSASAGTALGLGAYSSHIELKYAAPVAAGETSYVRIEFENDELNALLGGSLGSDLADLLGSVALGDHYFTVTPKTAGGTDIYTASSAAGFGTQDVRVVQDESGRFYIAFTADQAYQSVRIDHFLTALIGAENTATMHVFSMCRETEFNLCEQATFTDFDGSGIAVDLLDITKGGVFNPQNAIDGNSSNYSIINLGIAGIGATVYQNIYFKTKSQTTDALRIRVQLNEPGILNLDLAGSYRLILYNGNDEVYNESLQDALINNLDLLGLLNSGGIQELLIEPGVVYDRVSFGLQSIAAINTSAPIRLYGISRISDGCPDSDLADPPYLSPVCAEELIDASFADNLANLFDGNFNSFATINSSGGALLTGIGAYSGHLTLGYGDGVVVPAGTTSYMRIDTDASLLDALLGGSVGGVLSDLLNTVVLGDHYFTVSANDASGTPLFTASSDNSFVGFNDQVKVVQDALGRYYLAITPNAAYNSITIEDHTDGGLFGEDNSINIYGLCYDTGAEACATGFTTSFDGSGITVDAGSIGSYGVTNAERALDNNNNDDYSEISLGTLGVAGSIQQNIQFRQTIPAGGAFKIKLGVGAGVLDADVFGRIEVVGYLDGVEVYDETLENAVLGNVNLVDLFNNGANEEIRISPGVAVDEIAVRLISLVSVTAVPNVRLYYILQDCETPDFQAWESYVIDGDPSLTSVSGGETIVYTIHVRNTGTVPMTDYLITDAIPANTTYVSGGVENGGVVTFENLNIAPGETVTVSFTVLVDENLTDVEFISNVALVKSLPEDPGVETYPALDNENPTDPDESGDTGTDIPVDPIFSAEIWKAVMVDGDANVTAVSGSETLVYTIFIRNTGNQDLTDLSIADALPNGITYVSGGTLVGNDVNFSLPGLAVGATSTVGSFTATVDADLTGIDEIINIAVANSADLPAPIESYPPIDNSNPTEPDTAADPGTVLDVTPVHAIDFDKIGLSNNADSDGKAIVGDIITYTLTVTNTGNKLLSDISVVDQIPANTILVDNGGGTAGAGTLTFDIASLAVGAMQEFIFTVQVDAVTGSDPIVNNAEAFYTDEVGGNASETAQHSMPTDCTTIDADDITLTADQSVICVGESTILHASLNGISIPNAEFRWYLDASLTGAYFAGADYEVSPTASTTYYVTVVAEGYCFSTPAATTSITVNELPDVPSTSSDITISEGFGTVLTASIDPMPADVEIVWYAEGGAELATGESYNTGILSVGVYTYYAGTRNTVTGCLSIDTTAVTVTVEPVTTDGDCTVANAQNNGTYAICVLCSVENPGNAVDGDINTYSRFVAPVAVTGGVWQELIFNQTGAAGDTIVITLGTGGSLLDLGVLSGLSFESYNGAAANGDGGVVDNNLVSLSLIGGNSKGEVRFVASGSFDRVRIEYTPLLGALESGWRIYQAEINYPGPTAVTENEEVCEGDTATLSATPAAGTTLRWYDVETGGTLLASGNSYTTPALTPAGIKTYYIAVVREGCEDPVRIPVNVTVNPRATAIDIQATGDTICEGDSFTLSAISNTVTNPVFRFYTSQDLTTEITDLTVSPAMTTTYFVTVSGDGVCENAPGDVAEVIVTVNPRAAASDIQATGDTICEGDSFTLSATSSTVTNPIFRFYTSQDLTTEITDLTVSPATTTTYYVTVSGDGVCENAPGDAAEVTVTVNPSATATDIQATGDTICEGDSFTLSATSSTVTNPIFRFYTSQALTTEITDLTVSPATTTTYYVTVSGDGVCENAPGDAAEVTVIVNPRAAASDIQATGDTICEGDSFTLSATSSTVTNPIFRFYTSQDLTTEITDLTVSPATTTTYYVTVSGDGVCENAPGDAAEVTVTVNPRATASDIQATGDTICEGDSFTLSATSGTVTNPIFRFYTSQDLTSEITDLTVSPATTTTYYVTVSGDRVCENAPGDAAEVTVTVNPRATATDIQAIGDTICEGDSFILSATSSTVTNPIFRFYTSQALTTEITDLTVSPATTTTYYVTVSGDGVCENAPGDAAEVTVTVNPRATATDIQATGDTICEGDSFTLSATSSTVTNPIFRFYTSQDLTTEITDLTVSPATTTTYYVTVSGDGVCENAPGDAAEVIVMVNPRATATDIQAAGDTICEGDTFTLSATSSTVTNPIFRFYTSQDLTTEITDLTVSPANTTTYYVTVSGDGVCENAPGDAAEVTVIVNPRAAATDIQATGDTICEGDSFTLSATSSTVTNPIFRFYTSQALTTEITDLTVNPATTTTYYVTVSGDGVCENALGDAAEVIVTVNVTDAPIANNPNQSFCTSDNATLSSIEIEGEGILWYASENSITPLNPTMLLVDGATYFASQTDPTTNCESVLRTPVMVFLTDCNTGDGLTIQKLAEDDVVYAGASFTYTISITNTNNTDIADVTITDELDNRLSYVSSSNSGQFDAGIVTWNIPTIAANSIVELTVLVSTSPSLAAGTQISNVVIVSSPDDPDSPKESDPEVVTVEKDVDLEITKTASASTVLAGGEFSYTISVTNTGQSNATDLTITDALPVGLSFISADNGGVNNAGTISWTVPTLGAGASIDLTLTVMVNADVASGTQISNVAIVSSPDDPDSPKESDPEVVTVEKDVDLTITKTANASTVLAGGEFNYTISVTNTGQSDAADLTITDALPAGLSFISADNGGVNNAGTISWTIQTLAAGASIDLTLTVMVNADVAAGTQISNVVIVSSPDDPDSPKESDPEVVTVEKDVDLEITKTASASTVLAGGEFSYTISVMNTGQSDATDLTITDALPSGLSFISADNGGVNNAGTISWTVPTLAAGASIDLTITVMVNADVATGTQISNVAIVSSPDDPDSPKESDPEVVTVEKDVDLEITKTASASTVLAGGEFSYTISVTNTGQSNATDLTITDALPVGLSFISADNGGVNNAGTISWTVPTLGAGASIDLTLTVMVNADVASGTQISNVAIVSSPDDPDSPKESDPEVVTVEKDVDLTITKTASALTVLAGGEFSYTISVTNNGQSDATDLTITDALPVGLSFISADNGGVNNAGTISWTIQTLAAGASIDLTLTVMVNADVAAGTQISNVVIVSSPDDPDSPKESDPEVVTVEKDVDLEITKTASASTVLAGGEFSYTISVMNTGQSDATDLTITDALPSGLSFISADNGGVNNAGTISWTIPTLAAGASIDLMVTVMVNTDVATGTQISNVAIVSIPDDPDSPKESDPEVVTVEKDVDLTITKTASASTVLAGGEFSYTISVTNTGQSDAADLTITDALPTGLSFISADNGGVNNAGTLSWTIPTLAAGASIDLTLTVMVNADVAAGTQISNVAIVSSPDDPDSPKESDPEVVEITDETSFTIVKTANVEEAYVGDEITYTISVMNVSTIIQQGISVSDLLPEGLTYSSSNSGGVLENGAVKWTVQSLDPNESIDFQLIVKVNNEAIPGDVIYNVAVVDSQTSVEEPIESDPGDGVLIIEDEEEEPEEEETVISITKFADETSVVVGQMIEYTIHVENTGDAMAYDIMVVDSLPAGTMAVSASPSGEISETSVVWMIGDLDVGTSLDIKVTLMVTSNEGSLINWVYVSGQNFPDESYGTDPIALISEVDLVLDKEVSSTLIELNSNFEYKISVTNNSGITSNNVIVTDVLPAAVEYIGADISSGTISYDLASRTLLWNLPSVNSKAVETMTVRVKAISEGTVSNTATVISGDTELFPSDNSDNVSHEQLLFEIPNVFTPNGDGINDTWVIRGLKELFQNNKLLVVNRWGVEVFKTDNYENDWNGDNLHGGTYFYQIQLMDGQGKNHTMTGYVTIIK
ncbi:gliding motility-associated C-terminal domain-containing protein [uncultured Algoriphagus sp.]|uniref:Ig-like domain-containing protein n=1 Tax=uncultured Algoriphagus sp. TaxID=417365 RepID=UPI0030EC542D